MSREKVLNICNKLLLLSFYLLAVGLTFSNALTEIATGAIIVLWLLRKWIEKDYKLAAKRLTLILLLFVLWNLASFINSGYMDESIRGLFKVIKHSLLFIATLDYFKKEKGQQKFLIFILGVAFFISLNGIIQRIIGVDLIRQRTLTPFDDLRRISSSFKHSNDFGAYLIVIMTIILSLFFSRSRRLKERILIILASLPIGWCLLATHSRGAWMGFVVAFLFLAAVKSKRLFVLILFLLLLSPIILPSSIKDRFSDISTLSSQGTVWERTKLWSGTINMIKDRPILGFGVNTYTKNFPKYKPKDYPDVRYTHNSYLHMAAEIGIIGLGIFLAFLISLLISVGKGLSRLKKGLDRDLSLGLFAGTIGFLVHCIVDTHLYSVTLSAFLFLCLGLNVAFRNRALNN
ncbi:MAG: O-antigen ligase family protein [Candidatus Omnitrophica bacterium]|nr:O-antigen ligase family protein [Candidatus Omnitrophota bacterium]